MENHYQARRLQERSSFARKIIVLKFALSALFLGGGTPGAEAKGMPAGIFQKAPVAVSGTVVDLHTKEPLVGVTVLLEGTTEGVSTDAAGKYTIAVPGPNAVLVFSYVGYVTQKVKVGSQVRTLNMTLAPDAKVLEEMVVIGYGEEKRSDLTGAVGTVKGEELQRTKSVSFLEGMQGRVAGVQITSSSGEPGGAVNINIRGANSINAVTSPLYVIDGVQIEAGSAEVASFSSASNPLNSINPADIESIEILKDASATAIFGSRGSNGVVIVTTKGRKGETSSLEFNTSFGLSWASKKLSMLKGQDYADYRFQLNPASDVWGETVEGVRRVRDFSQEPSTDWQEEVLRKATSQNYNLVYSGGNAHTSFATSLGYFKQQGIVKRNEYDRYSLNLKIDHAATDKFRLGTNINGSYGKSSGVASSNGGQTIAYSGVIQSLIMFKPLNVAGEGLNTADPDNLGQSSPNEFINFSLKETPFTRAAVNAYAEYKFLPNLVFRATGGGILTTSENGEFYPSTTSWGYARNGMGVLRTSNTLNWSQVNTLTYRKNFQKGHYLNALLGAETYAYVVKTFSIRAEGFDVQSINGVDNIQQAKVFTELPTTNKEESTRMSHFGRLNYNYKNKYFATATLRRDASSKFGPNNKASWFPSGALAYNLSKESFMQGQSLVSNLKLRTSAGITGNERIPPYSALAKGIISYYSNPSTSEPGIAFTSIANPDLKWETTYLYDAGLDLEFGKGRVALTVDVYQKETKDMLLNADIPGQTGYFKQWQNIGQVNNRGMEIALNTKNVESKNFSWTSNLNITLNRNKVVSLGAVSSQPITISDQISNVGRVLVGQPIGTGYGFEYTGIYQLDDFVDPNPANGVYALKEGVVRRTGVSVKPGDFKYRDLNGDNIVDNTNDQTVISDSNPDHYGGFTNSFAYKNFDLNVLLQWSYGNEILNVGRYRYEGYQNSNLSTAFWQNRWTPENPTNDYPALNADGRYSASSYYVEDGSYLRLKNVTLGYNFQPAALSKARIRNFRLYVTGENLLTLTKYTGFDPEVASNNNLLPGLENISYPRATGYTFGLNVSF